MACALPRRLMASRSRKAKKLLTASASRLGRPVRRSFTTAAMVDQIRMAEAAYR